MLVALATDFRTNDPSRPNYNADRLAKWRAVHAEHRSYDGRDLAQVPTVFDKLDAGLCRALVYRGWWLVGAALAAYASDRLPVDLGDVSAPQLH